MWQYDTKFHFSCFYLDSADLFDGFIVALNRWELEALGCRGTNIPGSKSWPATRCSYVRVSLLKRYYIFAAESQATVRWEWSTLKSDQLSWFGVYANWFARHVIHANRGWIRLDHATIRKHETSKLSWAHGYGSWLMVWNMAFIFPYIGFMSSSQLTFSPSFFRGVGEKPPGSKLRSSSRSSPLFIWSYGGVLELPQNHPYPLVI